MSLEDEKNVVLDEAFADPVVMRELLKSVDEFKRQRVFFIPMPVLNFEDMEAVENEMKRRLHLISEESEKR